MATAAAFPFNFILIRRLRLGPFSLSEVSEAESAASAAAEESAARLLLDSEGDAPSVDAVVDGADVDAALAVVPVECPAIDPGGRGSVPGGSPAAAANAASIPDILELAGRP